MITHIHSHSQVPDAGCELQFAVLYRQLTMLNEHFSQFLVIAQYAKGLKPLLRDASYTRKRLGVSARSLLRFQQCGDLPVSERVKGKKYYLDEDVERFFRKYRGG